MTPPAHQHDWHEMGRVFPFTEADHDRARLSPDGIHHPDHEDGRLVLPADLDDEKMAALFNSKVPAPTPHVILQCQDPDCPDGPKQTIHVDLHKSEWTKLQDAYDRGLLDPDGNGTNRLVSTASLADLGLGRIQDMLGPGRHSGAKEALIT